jgi:hypothetical protein
MTENTEFDRRTVMKGLGAAALGGLALSASAGSAAAASGSMPGDLKIVTPPYVSDNNIDNKPSYNLNFGARFKDENAPYSRYTAYGFFKLFNWKGVAEEAFGPFVLSGPSVKTINESFSMRDLREGWYRGVFTLLIIDSENGGEIAYVDTAYNNFRFEK